MHIIPKAIALALFPLSFLCLTSLAQDVTENETLTAKDLGASKYGFHATLTAGDCAIFTVEEFRSGICIKALDFITNDHDNRFSLLTIRPGVISDNYKLITGIMTIPVEKRDWVKTNLTKIDNEVRMSFYKNSGDTIPLKEYRFRISKESYASILKRKPSLPKMESGTWEQTISRIEE